MITEATTEAETTRHTYLSDFAEDVAAVDDLAKHVKGSSENRLATRTIRLWPQAIQKTLAEYDGTGASEKDVDIAKEILNRGSINGTRIDVEPLHDKLPSWRDTSPDMVPSLTDATTAYNRRIFLAHLAISAPQDLAIIIEREVFAFHGTKGFILPNIIGLNGLLSHATMHKEGLPVGTGDPNPDAYRRDYVSFSSIQERAAISHSQMNLLAEKLNLFHSYPGYEMRANELKEFRKFIRESINAGNRYTSIADPARFGILLGLSRPALWMSGVDPDLGERISVEGNFPEYAFKDEVPTTYLPVIAAPSHRKDIERFLAKNDVDITVISTKTIERAQDLMRRPV